MKLHMRPAALALAPLAGALVTLAAAAPYAFKEAVDGAVLSGVEDAFAIGNNHSLIASQVSTAEGRRIALTLSRREDLWRHQGLPVLAQSDCMNLEAVMLGLPTESQRPAKAQALEGEDARGLTVETCYYHCLEPKTMYFGLQGGRFCTCFDTYTKGVGHAFCDAPCEGNATQTCGGKAPTAYSVHLMYMWVPQVEEKPCGKPPIVMGANETCHGGGGDLPKDCAVSCMQGYRLRGSGLVCDTVRGVWTGSARCVEVKCQAPARIPNMLSSCSQSSAVGAGACQVKCLPGYDLVENSLHCTAAPDPRALQGYYTGRALCQAKQCGPPPPHEHARVAQASVSYPAAVTYTCENGFTLNGKGLGARMYRIQCQETGDYASTDLLCKPVQCGPAPVIDGSMIIGDESEEPVMIRYPTVLEYQCDTGYFISSGVTTFQVACQTSGEFTTVPECKPVSCGLPLSFAYAEPQVSKNKRAALAEPMEYLEEMPYECKAGYSLSDEQLDLVDFTATCTSDGSFTTMLPEEGALMLNVRLPVSRSRGRLPSQGVLPSASFGRSLRRGGASKVARRAQRRARRMRLKLKRQGRSGRLKEEEELATGTGKKSKGGNGGEGSIAKVDDEDKQLTTGTGKRNEGGKGGKGAAGKSKLSRRARRAQRRARRMQRKLKRLGRGGRLKGASKMLGGKKGGAAARRAQRRARRANSNLKKRGRAGRLKGARDIMKPPKTDEEVEDAQQSDGKREDEKVEDQREEASSNIENGEEETGSQETEEEDIEKEDEEENEEDEDEEDASLQSAPLLPEQEVCQACTCGVPPMVANAFAPTGQVKFPQSVTYSCETGYTLDGQPDGPNVFTLACLEDGDFQKPPACLPVLCAAIPKYSHTDLAPTSKEKAQTGVAYPMVLEYLCDEGYSLDRSPDEGARAWTLQCLPNGRYTQPKPCFEIDDCIGHTCGPFGRCVDGFKNYTCNCTAGYEPHVHEEDGELLCGNIDDCGPEACGAGGSCLDLVEGYTCECDEGWELVTEGDDKTCSRVICGAEPEVEHATAPSQKMVFGDSVDYICDAGYTVDGTSSGEQGFSVTCQSSGDISGQRTCKAVQCGSPEAVDFAEIVNTALVFFPGVVSYRCFEGHSVDGLPTGNTTFSVPCTAAGTFAAPLECKPIDCGPPPRVAMAQATPQRPLVFGGTASYTCAEGHSTDPADPSKRQFEAPCEADGGFGGLLPCMPVLCQLPQKVAFASAATPDKTTLAFEEQIDYTCIPGRTVTGQAGGVATFSVTCGADGKAIGFAECRRVECASVPETPHAMREGVGTGKLLYGDDISFTCAPGYALDTAVNSETTFSLRCLATGDFSAPVECKNIDDCVGHSCGPHGSCVDLVGNYTCQCEEGFELNLLPNGQKVCGNVDDCGPDACGEHGRCIDLVSEYACDCSAGYESVRTGEKDKVCRAVQCPSLPRMDHTNVEQEIEMMFPKAAQVACETGYSIDSTAAPGAVAFTVSCQVDGSLSPVTPCQPVQCGLPPVVFNTKMSPPAAQRFVFGQTAEYTCADGYNVDGTRGGETHLTFSCGQDGTFPPVQHCRPIVCRDPPPLAHSAVVGSPQVTFSSAVVYECNPGFAVSSASPGERRVELRCLASGLFEDMPQDLQREGSASCARVSCGEPPVYDHATVSPGTRYYGDVAEYRCEEAHTTDGTPRGAIVWSVACSATGALTSPLATSCQPMGFRVSGVLTDATNLRPVANAQVTLQQNAPGAFMAQGRTDNAGAFQFDRVPPVSMKMGVTADGYIQENRPLTVSGDMFRTDLSMSPVLPPNDYRVVLRWGVSPRDVDSYLYFGSGFACRVYYARRRVRCPNGMIATLDVDDQRSYGPETITITGVQEACRRFPHACKMVFKAYVYSRGYDVSHLGDASVKLYRGSAKAGEFRADQSQGYFAGKTWLVMSIDGKTGQVAACRNPHCT